MRRSLSSAWLKETTRALSQSVDDKSLVPYRQCSADRVPLIPCCGCGAVWIRRFVLNRVGIWQDNCFKEFHCSAAISYRLWHRICDCGDGCGGVQHAICPAKSYTAFSYPRSGFSANPRVAGYSIAILNSCYGWWSGAGGRTAAMLITRD